MGFDTDGRTLRTSGLKARTCRRAGHGLTHAEWKEYVPEQSAPGPPSVRRESPPALATGGGSLLVVGEVGAGSTSLLDAAAAHAAELGTRVLRASGVEFEAEVNFAGLHQLVAPLAAEPARVASDARRAIGVAVGLAEGPAPDQLA